jgi:hypothetical protein
MHPWAAADTASVASGTNAPGSNAPASNAPVSNGPGSNGPGSSAVIQSHRILTFPAKNSTARIRSDGIRIGAGGGPGASIPVTAKQPASRTSFVSVRRLGGDGRIVLTTRQ